MSVASTSTRETNESAWNLGVALGSVVEFDGIRRPSGGKEGEHTERTHGKVRCGRRPEAESQTSRETPAAYLEK